MSRPRTTAGKRNLRQQRRARVQAEKERMAGRGAAATADAMPLAIGAARPELIDEPARMHGAFEAATITLDQLDERPGQIGEELMQIGRSCR